MDDNMSVSFRKQLLMINEHLGTEEVEALKFLCSDLLSFRQLEAVKSAQDIFQFLMTKDFLNKKDTFILAELLYRIRYHSLLQDLGYTKEEVRENLCHKGKVSNYRQMLYELSEDITREDLQRAMFLLRDKLPKKLTSMQSCLELLTFLEKQALLAENNLQTLEKICEDISPDLLAIINKYKMERVSVQESSLSANAAASFSHHCLGQFHSGGDVGLLISSQETPVKSLGSKIYESYSSESGSLREHVESVHFIAARQDDKAVNVTHGISELREAQPARTSDPENKIEKPIIYKMDGPHRGYCLIINNSNFIGTLQERRGSCKDAESLARVFTWLGLDVKTYPDQTSVEIENLMQEWRTWNDHRDRDCFVCCILSHGESGSIYGADEQEVPIRRIMSYFTARQCPQLAEKPKLFFIQACQGKEIQQAVYIEADAQNPDLLPIQQRVSPSESIPEEADFLLGMATVDGYASFRHIQQGTWYIQALCNKLQLLVPRGEDILSILTEVNEDVSKRADNLGRKKQMPQPAYTLRKKLIFPVPRNPPPLQQQ
uniref:Caspase 10 n=1 Tax=Pelodiscus sinensis TaxID=13735 RepID=K7F8C1_PELSI|nr:caspase-10-like isoform X1 [Pelodiscus sinensis]XP_006120135.1 caspase-10-like isoform X1 [Pelodiscus sinensis]|eukprot:XP_006120134.1 caspase-10-like isoform X1 [Pelodiscus sinensis]